MGPHQRPRMVLFAGVALIVACHGPTITTTDDSSSTTSSDGSDTPANLCDGAALEYGGVCFYPHSVAAMGLDHPLDLDGQPGDELVGVDDGRVSVHKWNGNGFDLMGQAELPGELGSSINAGVVAGEFDDAPGIDLIVAENGEWVALYHLSDGLAPEFVATTPLAGGDGFLRPVAVGPDDTGKWRIVAHYDNGDGSVLSQPLSLWEVQGSSWVGERIELPTQACALQPCAGGDFNGDGRQDAVCTLMDYCSYPSPEEYIVHVVLLAQADGSVSVAAYPTSAGPSSSFAADVNDDGFPDLVATLMYRLGDGAGGLGPVVAGLELPTPPKLDWGVVSIGDIDHDGDHELVIGDHQHVLVFGDRVGAPSTFERFTLAGGFEFGPVNRPPIDVNADGIVDLPVRDGSLLVSEVAQ